MLADPLLDLDDSQRAAVQHNASLLAILAPAGSGKTRVLTRRIAWLAAHERVDPRRVLAVTFTRKAAGELRARLATPGGPGAVTAGTFHALALAALRRRARDAGREFPQILDRKARVLGPLLGARGASGAVAINEIASEIEWAKARALNPDEYEAAAVRAARQLPRPAPEIAALYRRYETEKRRRRVVDFDDLLWGCADAFDRDPDFAAAQRFRFRHFFVDEFQDVTPAQLRLLRAWLGTRRDLTVVGDDAQAIYSFAGAEPTALAHFDRLFTGAAIVRLSTNYRSTPQIVAVADAALGSESGVRRATPLAPRPPGALPVVVVYDDDDAEARGVARAIRSANDAGTRFGEIAVLYRTNAQSALFEAALTKLGIPQRIRGASRFLARPEVRATIEAMRAAERQARGRAFADHLADLHAAFENPDEDPDNDRGEDDGAVPATNDTGGEDRLEHVEALVRLGHEYLAADGGSGSLAGFLSWLDSETRRDDPSASDDAVELCSFHAAKGLEWSLVFVTGVEAGLVPISYARTAEARAEEQRLLHVALSRAELQLQVSWARQRGRARRPSPWVATIEETLAALARGQRPLGPADRREQLNGARATLREAAPPGLPIADRALLAELKEWRRNAARAHGLPAYTIFSDRTLNEIAAGRPTTQPDLLAVHGIGDAKLDRYGDAVLTIVRSHARQ